MQLVIHSPYGSRINRAWGLALRKRFCRKFNFELQAAATEDNIVLSLTTAHSFELAEVARYLHSASVRQLLIQALLDAPMFITRWRWVAGVALALPRFRGGKKVPPQLARMDAEDLIARGLPRPDRLRREPGRRARDPRPSAGAPDDRRLPDRGDGHRRARAAAGAASRPATIRVVARDLTEPSPLALEVLSARPYAYLDDAPLEERRTQAVMSRRWLAPEDGRRSRPARSPRRSRGCAPKRGPRPPNADELHDALVWLGFLDRGRGRQRSPAGATGWRSSRGEKRVARLRSAGARRSGSPPNGCRSSRRCGPRRGSTRRSPRQPAMRERGLVARGGAGRDPARPARRAGAGRRRTRSPRRSGWSRSDIAAALAALEAEGFALRGRFTPRTRQMPRNGASAGCWRASTATRSSACAPRSSRSRRATSCASCSPGSASRRERAWKGRTRSTPSSASSKVSRRRPAPGRPRSCRRASPATSRPGSTTSASPAGRLGAAAAAQRRSNGGERGAAPVRTTPITLLARRHAALWASLSPRADVAPPSPRAQAVADFIREHGASFFDELVEGTGLLRPQVEEALAELVALGLVNSDSFGGLRALLVPSGTAPTASRARRRRTVALRHGGRRPLGAGAPRAARGPSRSAERERRRSSMSRALCCAATASCSGACSSARPPGCRRGATCCASIAGSRRAAKSAAAASSPASPASNSRCPRRSARCARSGASRHPATWSRSPAPTRSTSSAS